MTQNDQAEKKKVTQKTVVGMTRNRIASRAAEKALSGGVGPEYVGVWQRFFDDSDCDHLRDGGPQCNGCKDAGKCEVPE